jgi:hypothetical protein
MRARRLAVAAAAALATATVLAGVVLAEPPFFAACGVIKAFTPATATVPGSITIADRVFALTARDRVDGAAVGKVACLGQTVTTSGPVFELVPLPAPVCGEVIGVSTASLDLVVRPTLRLTLGFGAGFSFADPGRAVVACFETGLDAAGRVVAVRSVAGAPTPAPPTPAPSKGVSTLPSTSTVDRP